MHPNYRKRLVKLVADIDQCCAGLEDLAPEEQEWAELAEVLRELLKTGEDRVEADCGVLNIRGRY